MRGRVLAVLSLFWTWAATLNSAEASCADSTVQLIVPAVAIGSTLPVSWQVDPRCDVIETGLLLGRDVTTLSPVGQPIYVSRGSYADEIPIGDSGTYWVAAYAMDESGARIQSRPRFVSVVVLPPVLGPYGSHGPLPFYTGTDDDFLKPAGEPHFASLRALNFLSGRTRQSVLSHVIMDHHTTSRVIASTHRDEVEAQQSQPLPFGFSPNTGNVTSALTLLEQLFTRRFPRPGLYAVSCTASDESDPALSTCQAPLFDTNDPRALNLNLAFEDELVTQSGFGITLRNTAFASSTATFFIPAPPPGKRVQTARLRAFFATQAAAVGAAAPQLNGRPPRSAERLICSPSFTGFDIFVCFGVLTWDFTNDAKALSAQGGGLLTIVPTPPPQGVADMSIHGEDQHIQISLMALVLAANFPWRHGGPSDNALTITFEAACPQDLKLTVTPAKVRPQLPSTTRLSGELATFPTQATVEAVVKTCPPQGGGVGSVQVAVRIDDTQPLPGTDDAGGHFHDTRPARARGTLDAATCLAVLDAQGVGSCMVTYRPSAVSSVETIVAQATGFADARTQVTVLVPALTNLADVRTNFFRLTGRTPTTQTTTGAPS